MLPVANGLTMSDPYLSEVQSGHGDRLRALEAGDFIHRNIAADFVADGDGRLGRQEREKQLKVPLEEPSGSKRFNVAVGLGTLIVLTSIWAYLVVI